MPTLDTTKSKKNYLGRIPNSLNVSNIWEYGCCEAELFHVLNLMACCTINHHSFMIVLQWTKSTKEPRASKISCKYFSGFMQTCCKKWASATNTVACTNIKALKYLLSYFSNVTCFTYGYRHAIGSISI